MALAAFGCSDRAPGDGQDASVGPIPLADGAVLLPDGNVVPAWDSGTSSDMDAGSFIPWVPDPALCGDGACQCSDGVNNDGTQDDLIDANDPECTGPSDNDESSFATGIAGDNRDPMWQDCFFDGNSGSGNDGCRYRTECLTGELPATDRDCQVSEQCRTYCQRAVPNGCDCFGCCAVELFDGSTVNVVLSATCSVEHIDDPARCTQCAQTTECDNPCGECELCPGRGPDDLPEHCFETPDGGMPRPMCEGSTACVADSDCPTYYYCSLGCCLPSLI